MKHLYSFARRGLRAGTYLFAPWALLLALLAGVPAAQAANLVLRIEGTGVRDVSAFVDQVQIVQFSNGTVVSGAVGNAGFETPNVGAGNFQYRPAGAPWTFNGNSGISQTGGGFSPPTPPEGVQVALVQGTAFIQQTLTLGAGTYTVKFLTSQRTNCCGTPYDQRLNVYIDNALVGSIVAPSDGTYTQFTSNSFAVDPPALTSAAPNPGGLGQSITLTGTNLSNPTALTINGANSLANIISNSGTSLVVRVPTGATASGSVSLTTAAGTATTSLAVMAAPGNALAFDGGNDNLHSNNSLPNTGEFTLEAWVSPATSLTGLLTGFVMSDNFTAGSMHCQFNSAGRLSFGINGNSPGGFDSNMALPVGRWSHVAVVYSASAKTLLFYLNGVLFETYAFTTAQAVAAQPYSIGGWLNGGNPDRTFNGRLDEVRIYSAALTSAQVLSDMRSTASALPASLAYYYNFDQGTPATASTGNNAGLTTLYDLVNARPATLTNFSLASGNTTSNWVESYALVVPTATAFTSRTTTGFTANWTASTLGVADSYFVDVATDANFTTNLTTTSATGLSQSLTGLSPTATYYYRVRATKSSVAGQGAYSNTVTVCPAAVAVAQNAVLALGTNGSATLAATAVNNGSTLNCAPAAASALSVSPSSFSCSDVVPATVARALSFNGSGQYVAIPTTATVPTGNSSYTIEAWIKPTQMGNYGIIGWGNYNNDNQVNALRLYSNGIINYWWSNDILAPTANLAGAWHHVAATYDQTTNTRKIYLDGVFQVQDTPPAGHNVPTAANLRIGSTNFNEYFPGSIDEVRVWNVARTAAQINAAKGAGLPGSTAGLVAYYRLNEGSGLTTADAGGNAANAGTLTGGPTWATDAAPVVNGTPVTLTATDANGNASTASAVVTVQDNTVPAFLSDLPAAPALASSNVPEASIYGVLYQLDMPNIATFNSLSQVPYTVNNASVSMAKPARVAYFMELTNTSGVTKWVWASMDNFATTLTQLGLPNPTANNVAWNQNVTNLNVFASSNAGVTTGTNLGTGRLEMWTSNYATNNASSVPGASGGTYDFGDQPTAGNYGSFQVHNVTAAQTLLAYNAWGSNGDGGGLADIGIGNQVGGSGHPDWTFSHLANTFTVKRLYILVPRNAAFTQSATVALGASGTATLSTSQVYTGATDNCTPAANLTVVVTPSTFTCAQVGTPQTVSVAVSDASGNTTTQSTTVTVTDNIVPTAVAQNRTEPLAVGGTATVTAAQINNNSTDNCSTTVGLIGSAELVTNGNFDTSAANWTLANGPSHSSTGGNPGGYLWLNASGQAASDPTATQTLTGLTVGTTYQLSGSYRNVANCCGAGAGAVAFGIDLSGTQIAALRDPGLNWTPFRLYFTATATSQALAFRAEIDGTDVDIAIDNISVRAVVNSLSFACTQVGANPVTLVVADASGNRSTATATVTVTAPPTPTTTWNGTASTNWNDCANWSFGKVPDAATNVVIPAGLAQYPNLTTGTMTAKDLTISSGVSLTLGSAATMQINGNFANNGTMTLNGTVAFVGNAATQTLSSATATSFTNLTVNKSAGTVELQQDLPLTGALSFTAGASNVGILTTGSFRVNMGASATISETETSYVLGKVALTRTLAAGSAQAFGGLGLTLTPAAGSAAPGLTPVVRTTGTALTGVGSSVSIQRNFDIQPAVKAGLNVKMDFSYFLHELNNIPEANLTLFKSETGAANSWSNQNPATLTTGTKTVTKSGITGFSIWTLGNSAAPLPVELTAFTATAEGPQAVRLAWATASEKNSDFFAVERSLDGAAFTAVGTVAAAGTSTSPRSYQLLDRQLPAGATVLYYRLRQQDTDGTFAHSPVRVVTVVSGAPAVKLQVHPNPSHGSATLAGAKAGAAVEVFDALGRLVLTATADASGTALLTLPNGQPAGMYVVRTGTQTTRLVLE